MLSGEGKNKVFRLERASLIGQSEACYKTRLQWLAWSHIYWQGKEKGSTPLSQLPPGVNMRSTLAQDTLMWLYARNQWDFGVEEISDIKLIEAVLVTIAQRMQWKQDTSVANIELFRDKLKWVHSTQDSYEDAWTSLHADYLFEQQKLQGIVVPDDLAGGLLLNALPASLHAFLLGIISKAEEAVQLQLTQNFTKLVIFVARELKDIDATQRKNTVVTFSKSMFPERAEHHRIRSFFPYENKNNAQRSGVKQVKRASAKKETTTPEKTDKKRTRKVSPEMKCFNCDELGHSAQMCTIKCKFCESTEAKHSSFFCAKNPAVIKKKAQVKSAKKGDAE